MKRILGMIRLGEPKLKRKATPIPLALVCAAVVFFLYDCQIYPLINLGASSSSSSLPVFSVTYNGNGNTGGNVPHDSNTYESGEYVLVLGNTGSLTKAGYNFTGWNEAADGSATSASPGSQFQIYSDVTLYAQWQ